MSHQSDGSVRLSVNLSPEVAAVLKELVRRKGTNISDAVRDAIATEAYLMDETDNDSKVLIKEKDGTLKQVILR